MEQPIFQTKSDYAYSVIKSEIMKGEIKPGERLVISKLAKKLNISEIPVRDAISRLTSEGLVDVGNNNRSVVSNITHKEFKEALEIRKILEPICSKLSVKYIEKDSIIKLYELIKEIENCIMLKDYENLSMFNRSFHMVIYSHCPNKKMVEMIEDLNKISNRASKIFQIRPTRCEKSNIEHKEIVEAIVNKDEDKVYELVLRQKEESFKMYMEESK